MNDFLTKVKAWVAEHHRAALGIACFVLGFVVAKVL